MCSNWSIAFLPVIERRELFIARSDAFRSQIDVCVRLLMLRLSDRLDEKGKWGHMAKMLTTRPFSRIIDLLRGAELRPTRQRLALAKILFENGDRHVTAESLHEEAIAGNIDVSLATVYNTLHQFVLPACRRFSSMPPGHTSTRTPPNITTCFSSLRGGWRTFRPKRSLSPSFRRPRKA